VKQLKYAPFYLLSLFPFWIIQWFSSMVYFVLFHIIGYRKKVVFENLKNSFPNKTDKEIYEIGRKFYAHFCDVFLEALKLLTISPKNIQKRFQIKNIELFNQLYKEQKSIILYSAHFGNWEWMTCFPLHSPYKFISFYQKLSNRYFDQFMLHLRQRFGNTCVESQSGFKELIKNTRNKKLTITYVIGDQSPMSNSAIFWTDFLNQETGFLTGADRMAQKCNQVMIFPFVQKPKRGYYQLEFKIIPMDEVQDPIETYARFLEINIQKQPELWLWSHRRWKRKRELKN